MKEEAMLKRVVMAFAILCGLAAVTVGYAGITATGAQACSGPYHES
jgi:hypothetical protein